MVTSFLTNKKATRRWLFWWR